VIDTKTDQILADCLNEFGDLGPEPSEATNPHADGDFTAHLKAPAVELEEVPVVRRQWPATQHLDYTQPVEMTEGDVRRADDFMKFMQGLPEVRQDYWKVLDGKRIWINRYGGDRWVLYVGDARRRIELSLPHKATSTDLLAVKELLDMLARVEVKAT
jgi:hypothetical protein